MSNPDKVALFIDRWSKAEAAERANYALFLTQLCGILDVPAPDPAGPDSAENAYVFERGVTFQHRGGKTTTGRIDLYKRGSFVCECKQYANQAGESDDLALAIDDPAAAAKKGRIARGSEAWDRAMIEAHGQADRYARSLPANEDPPPSAAPTKATRREPTCGDHLTRQREVRGKGVGQKSECKIWNN